MSVVYEARQKSLNRKVALKVIRAELLASESQIRRFRAEAEAAGHLEHPNIVPVYEVGEERGRLYLALRLIEGGSLANRISDFGFRASEAKGSVNRTMIHERQSRIATLLVKIARAVHYAHARGILHRDLKPGNILLDRDGEPLVADFGIARRLSDEGGGTLTGTIIGSPAYMAPEQAAGTRNRTTAVDVYGLGVILYELLTGLRPFTGETPLQILAQVKERLPERPRSRVPEIDVDLETICLKCLEKEPSRRYSSAAALVDDLDRWLAGQPIAARPVGAWERLWLWRRRKPVVAALSASVALLAFAVAVGSTFALHRINRERRHALEQELEARRHAYAADMLFACEAVREGFAGRAHELLSRHEPVAGQTDLRGIEWRWLQAALRSDETATLWIGPNPIEYFAVAQPGRWFVRDAFGSNRWILPAASLNLPALPNSYRSRLSPSGRFLVLQEFTLEKHLQVWDALKNVELFTVQPTWMQTWLRGERIAFSPDASRLYVGENEGEISVWDLTTHAEARRFPAFTSDVQGLAPSERGDWRAPLGGVALSPNGDWLAVAAGREPRMAIWNARTHEQAKTVAFDGLSEAYTLLFSPDGETLASAHLNGELAVWNAADLRLETTLRADGTFCTALKFSQDGRWLAAADGLVIRIWAAGDWALRGTFKGHRAAVTSLTFNANGNLLSAARDGTIKEWTVPPRERSAASELAIPFVDDAGWSAGKRTLVTVNLTEDTVRLWSLAPLKMTAKLPRELRDASCGAVTEDGGCLVIGHDAGSITLQRAPFDSMQRQPAHGKAVIELAFSADGAWLASASYDDTLRLHRIASTGLLERTTVRFDFHHGSRLRFSPDARTLTAFSPNTGRLTVFGVPVLDAPRSYDLPPAGSGEVAFSPDGHWLVVGTSDGTLRVWSTPRFDRMVTLDPLNLGVRSIAFSPDGRRLASQLAGLRLALWDTTTWRKVGDFDLPRAIHGLAFAPDGQSLILVDQRRLLVWPAANGEEERQ